MHFLASVLKIFSEKNLYYFLKKPDLKQFLIFSGNITFLCFGKGIFRTLAYLELKVYSEHCQTSAMEGFTKIATYYLAHFSAQARKNKKLHPEKIPCVSGNETS